MLLQRGFNFLRRNIRAAADDDLFLSAFEPVVPVLVTASQIVVPEV